MNEIFDKLILRLIFTFFICTLLFLYKYAHTLLYPSTRTQLFKKFYPAKNSTDTIHFFSRLIGIGLIFSEFTFYISEGIELALAYFFIHALLSIVLYLASIYIIESIVLYNFEYEDEILKRKNFAYATISFSHAVSLGILLKTIIKASSGSLILLFFIWLLAMVLMGFATKSFSLISKLPFNRLLIQKEMSVGFSYLGFFAGWSVIIGSAFQQPLTDIRWYAAQIVLKIILSLIIFPIFNRGIRYVFKIQHDVELGGEDQSDSKTIDTGYGIYEGAAFFTCAFLTNIITSKIHFGTFYPIF